MVLIDVLSELYSTHQDFTNTNVIHIKVTFLWVDTNWKEEKNNHVLHVSHFKLKIP